MESKNTNRSLFDQIVFNALYWSMVSVVLTKTYPCSARIQGNFAIDAVLLQRLAKHRLGITVSLLRSRLGRLAFDVIPERFSSSLPPLFASGRFATFLSFSR